MRDDRTTRRDHGLRAFAGVVLLCTVLPGFFAAYAGPPPPPISLAMFDFELEDLSAGPGESPADTRLLEQISGDARRMIANSGRYRLIDVSRAGEDPVKGRWLHQCHGCDAGIARKLGAEQSLVGFVTRISRTDYMVRILISDTRSGAVVADAQSGLRMGADYSWGRGVAALINGRLLKNHG
jgi:hypothetical protein